MSPLLLCLMLNVLVQHVFHILRQPVMSQYFCRVVRECTAADTAAERACQSRDLCVATIVKF